MIDTTTGQAQAGGDVRKLQIRQFTNHLLWRQAIGQQVQDVRNTDTHPADARTAAALGGIHGDATVNGAHIDTYASTIVDGTQNPDLMQSRAADDVVRPESSRRSYSRH